MWQGSFIKVSVFIVGGSFGFSTLTVLKKEEKED
jgi:hypothetical protein